MAQDFITTESSSSQQHNLLLEHFNLVIILEQVKFKALDIIQEIVYDQNTII